jgi:hypothetical protein
MVRAMGPARSRTQRLGAAIFGLLLGIFALRAFVDTPGLSLVFLYAGEADAQGQAA